MNVTEANATNVVLHYLLGTTGPAGPVTADQAEKAAEVLANRAHKALAAGYTSTRVRELWPTNAVTLDLTGEHSYFALTAALGEWAHRQRGDAETELAEDPEDTTAALRLEWAATADKLLASIEAAL